MKSQVKLNANPQTERQHQINVIRWSMLHRNKYPELKLLHAIPNGGKRDPVEAKHLQEEGVKRGVPDLFLPVARKEHYGLYVEMKRPDGKESPEQTWWREQLAGQNYFVHTAHGWESAVRVIEWYLKINP